jgi:dienelactone hydrolase
VTKSERVILDSTAGYLAIAPAMFDRTERDVELDYTQMERGLALANSIADAARLAQDRCLQFLSRSRTHD